MSFKILTLDFKAFADTCRRLQHMVEDSGFIPDIVIGIPTGGVHVADCFEGYIKQSVKLIRPPRNKFKKYLKHIIRLLPRAIIDRIRILEAHLLVRQGSHMSNTVIELPDIDVSTVRRILLVDDAVDSGATLKAVRAKLTEVLPEIEIRTAVLTVTGKDVSITPDFCVYNNQTLIRNPWSIDK